MNGDKQIGCRQHVLHSARVEPIFRSLPKARLKIYSSYILAVILALCFFIVPFTDAIERFGALLILIPTAMTGLHVYSINLSNNLLTNSISQVGSALTCKDCQNLFIQMHSASDDLGSQLRVVIICETVLASIGTAIWAFGDCFSLSCFVA